MAEEADRISTVRSLDPAVLSESERRRYARMLSEDVCSRRASVNRADIAAWQKIRSREQWETFRAPRLEALRRSLGTFPNRQEAVPIRATRCTWGDGYRIEHLVYETRPRVLVTANLYAPTSQDGRRAAIVLVHSHHHGKTQGELQDMGMTWARSGCLVLIPDQLGYGERRDHPPGPRQDYRYRYVSGIQLHVIGDSLMGWMVWDVWRGIDLLLDRADVDPERIIVMGAVAGGGDVAAVAAALDERVACAVPFNFGGPQPETPYPLPDDAEERFDYLGEGSWESTRSLRLSGRDGFPHWLIVAAIAPRRLIYAHEFAWDCRRDPVWKRLQRVYGFYGATDRLAYTHGAGELKGRPPEATHCNQIGAIHRRGIYAALQRWFGLPTPVEYSKRLPDAALACHRRKDSIERTPLHRLYDGIGRARAAAFRAELRAREPSERRARLQEAWAAHLGEMHAERTPRTIEESVEEKGDYRVHRIALEVDPGVVVPVILLWPHVAGGKPPVVVAIAGEGKDGFLRERSAPITQLLGRGIAVCLPDVRGTGETRPDASRGMGTEMTSISASELMIGRTLVGLRLDDLRKVLRHLEARTDVDGTRIGLWGDSFTPANPPAFVDPPLGEGDPPTPSEPLGGLIALLAALYENVSAVVARRTLAGYGAVLRDPFCYVPHEAIVPGALTAGDLCDVAAAFAPRPLRLEGLVDGRNCLLSERELRERFAPTIGAYGDSGNLWLTAGFGENLGAWFANALNADGQADGPADSWTNVQGRADEDR